MGYKKKMRLAAGQLMVLKFGTAIASMAIQIATATALEQHGSSRSSNKSRSNMNNSNTSNG